MVEKKDAAEVRAEESPALEEKRNETRYALLIPYATPDGREVKEIEVRPRLTARDMREISRRTKRAEDYELSGVAVMCGMVEDDLLDMDARDYLALRDRFFRRVGIAGSVSEG